jgi:hypothetical protein
MTRAARALGQLAIASVLALAARPGVPPDGPWACPAGAPIKGYLSQSGRVYFLPGTAFYDEASPERCYASEDEARRDGAAPVREAVPAPRRDDRV